MDKLTARITYGRHLSRVRNAVSLFQSAQGADSAQPNLGSHDHACYHSQLLLHRLRFMAPRLPPFSTPARSRETPIGAMLLFTLAFYSVTTALPAAEIPITTPLTLEAALAISVQEHPDAFSAHDRLTLAQVHLRQAYASLLPQLVVASSYQVTDQPGRAFLGMVNQGTYSTAINPNDPPTVDNLNLGVTLSVPLYVPGTWSGRLAALHGNAVAHSEQAATRNALELTTTQAFISVHRAHAYVHAAEVGWKSSESHLTMAQQRHEAGTLARADLLDFEAASARSRYRLVSARGGLELAGQALAAALGREGTFSEVAQMPELSFSPEYEYRTKPEVIVAREQVAVAGAKMEQARAQHMPRVGAFGGYDYDRGFKREGDGYGWHLGVGIAWTLYSGGAIEAGVDEAHANRHMAEVELRRTLLLIQQGRSAARTRLVTIKEQQAMALTQVTAAEESARLQSERFAAGSATSADVLAAEDILAQARTLSADAEAGHRMALADARWNYGLPILP